MLKQRQQPDSEIEWQDITDERTKYYGEVENKDTVRKGSKLLYEYLNNGWNLNKSNESNDSDIDDKIRELQKERQKFYDQRTAYKKILRERSREEELNDIISDSIKSGILPYLDYKPHEFEFADSDMLISLNDLHFGAHVDNFWNKYNSDICQTYLCKYLDEILSYQALHKCENCVVWENGDTINGLIHFGVRIENRENVIQQVMGVSELISDFLFELSKHFNIVSFVSVSGNHSRLDTEENSMKDERLDDLVGWYLKARLQNVENIKIGVQTQLDETMYLINIRGLNYLGVHGDWDENESKTLKAVSMVNTPIYAVLSGHKHHNKVDEIQGIKTIMAGSFLGTNDYCIQKRIYGKPEQLLCVCTENGANDFYDVVF